MTQLSDDDRAVLDTYRRPRPATWDLGRPALLVVDVVESFVGRDVPVVQAQQDAPHACGVHAWRALPVMRGLLDAFRACALPIAFSTISDPFRKGPAADLAPPRHGRLRSDTVVAELAPRPDELVLPKARPSAFFGTPLAAWLTQQGVDTAVVVGGATSGCIRATVVDAYSHGFEVVLPVDGCFDRVVAVHQASVTDLDLKYARAVAGGEVLARLG